MTEPERNADNYLAHIHDFDSELLDPVAGLHEWNEFKRALKRWVAEQDASFDELARHQEHGREP